MPSGGFFHPSFLQFLKYMALAYPVSIRSSILTVCFIGTANRRKSGSCMALLALPFEFLVASDLTSLDFHPSP